MPTAVKVRIAGASWKPMVVSMGTVQLVVRNEAIEQQRQFTQSAIDLRMTRGNAAMHSVMTSDKKPRV